MMKEDETTDCGRMEPTSKNGFGEFPLKMQTTAEKTFKSAVENLNEEVEWRPLHGGAQGWKV